MAPKVGHKMIPVKCPLCNFSHRWHSKLELHIKEVHGRDPSEVWREWKGVDGLCKCGCGQLTNWGGWSLGHSEWVIGHNGNIYTLPEEEAKAISEKRSKALMGRPGWSKGLTKETSEIVRKRSETISEVLTEKYANGELTNWAKGLTKDTDERMQLRSEHLKEGYAEGKFIPWAKGLTKDTDDRVFRMSEKVKSTMKREDLRKRLDHLKRMTHDELRSRIETLDFEIIGGLDEYINRGQKIITVKCKSCGAQFTDSFNRLEHGKCFNCHPGGSKSQLDIINFVTSLGVQIKKNDRKVLEGLELDILAADEKFAIEYNGLYWHNELSKSKQYHDNKTKNAAKKGINLIHIFEDEWRTKRPVVEDLIRKNLGCSQLTMFSQEDCTIVELTAQQKIDFFDKCSLIGKVDGTRSFGFMNGDNIIAAVQFRKHREKKWSEYNQLIDYAHIPGGDVIDGLNTLLTNLSEQFGKKWIHNFDARFGSSHDFTNIGFKQIGTKDPEFWWTDCENRFNRFMYRADAKLGLTEAQVADAANVVKIWGCHSKIFTIELSDQRA